MWPKPVILFFFLNCCIWPRSSLFIYRKFYLERTKPPTTINFEIDGVYLLDFSCSGIQFYLLFSPYLCFISLLYTDLYVLGDDALIS